MNFFRANFSYGDNMTKLLYLLMILFLMVALGGCDDSEDISVPKHTPTYSVKMGGIFPFTGALSEFGKPLHQSALLAVKHLNNADFSIGWAVVDSKSNPDAGVEAAHELIGKGQVQVIIGAAASSTTIAVAEQVSIPNQMLQIAYPSTSPEITTLLTDDGQDFLFRTVPSDALQGVVLANFAYDEGYRNLSVLYIDNAYGKGLKNVFKKHFSVLGGTVVAEIPHAETKGNDIKVKEIYLTKLQEAKIGETEALVAMSYSEQSNVYIQQAIQDDFFNKFLFVDGSKSEDIIETVGADKLEGMCGTAPSFEQTESLDHFNDGYEAEYGRVPSLPFMPNTYDAVVVAGLAAYAARAIGESINPITIRNYLRRVNDPDGENVIAGSEGLKRAMKMLDSGLTINYEGASGNVDFDENGDVITPIEIWCFEGGKIVHKENVQPDV